MSVQTSPVPIRVGGRYLWRGDNRVGLFVPHRENDADTYRPQFFVRGVVYNSRGTFDPISDDCLLQLERDIVLFKELGLNTLFVCSFDKSDTP